ncbi:MAG: HAD family hydrolase [Bacteroidota bacterium]|nr:HAD family hydrolase [Bacteroidota bacterium]
MNIEGVIFDLDGTLVHTIEDIMDAANTMFKQYGLPVHHEADYLRWIGNGAAKLIESALSEDHDPGQLQAYVTSFKEIYSKNLHSKSRLYNGIPGMLDELINQGIKLSILSNKPHHLTEQVAGYYLSNWSFISIFGQREGVPRKPDPYAAEEIADIMNVDAQKIMFVGDSPYDLKTAMAADMIPVGVTWGYGRLDIPQSEGVIKYIRHPDELVPLILLNEKK